MSTTFISIRRSLRTCLEARAVLQWFQDDGVSVHNQINDRNYLHKKLLSSWVGRNAPVAWPLRPPDLSVLDLFMGNSET